jgi:hypothetical protein
MTVAGTIAYKFHAHATYLHVYTLTGMPVSATQIIKILYLLPKILPFRLLLSE